MDENCAVCWWAIKQADDGSWRHVTPRAELDPGAWMCNEPQPEPKGSEAP